MSADLADKLRRTPPLDHPYALAVALGLKIARRATARQVLVCCPWHEDRSPSCSVRLAKDETIAVKCHACGATGDALSLIAQVNGLHERRDFRRVLDDAARLTGKEVRDLDARPARSETPQPDAAAVTDETYDRIACALLDACSPLAAIAPNVVRYLDARGIYADAEACGVRGLPDDCRALVAGLFATFGRTDLHLAGLARRGHDGVDWSAWCLLIPWRDRFGRVSCVQRRRLDDGDPRYRFPRGRAPRDPFGVDLLAAALDSIGPGAEVVIVEGALDCLARRRVARHRDERCAVIGIASASSPCVGLPLDLILGRRVVLAVDGDDAGERACADLATALHEVACELVRERPTGAKDWGAALVKVSA